MNKTEFWWLGLPFGTLYINNHINSGTKISPFKYLYGEEGSTRGVGDLCIPNDILKKLSTESELNSVLKLAEGVLFEWVGRQRPQEPLIEEYEMCSPIKPGEVLTVQNGKITMKEATQMPPVGTLNENLVDTSRKQNDEGAMIGATLLPAVAVVDTTSRKRHSPDKELLQGTSPDDIIMDN